MAEPSETQVVRSPEKAAARPSVKEEHKSEVVATVGEVEIGEEIASGGVGRILRAFDRHFGREVVAKVPRVGADRLRFAREASITAQLEHPAIVPVHAAGKLADGTPFYVMKLLAGRALRDAIAEAGTLAERMALLPVLIAACDAIAYAHSRKVIHRDLKPANVLVGPFGETTVVDWGMAKRVDEQETDAPGDVALLADGDAHTQTGAVLGTPAYMAPEQARGEALDARADVYALGAMLYHLVAGEAPYGRSGSRDVIGAVLSGPPVPVTRKQPQVSAELAAIVHKAMSRAPADRYPSARELADDLKRFQAGRMVAAHVYSARDLLRRWLRRYRGPVAVGLVGIAALAVVGLVAIQRVVTEKDRAQEQRAAAEELVDFMLVDLGKRLRRVGKLEVLDAVAGKVDAFYRRLAAMESEPDPGALRRQAQAFAFLGNVRLSQAEVQAALAAQAQSVEIARRLTRLEPASSPRRLELSQALAELAQLEIDTGDWAGGQERFDEALGLAEKLLAEEPRHPGWLAWKASVLARMAQFVGGYEHRIDKSLGQLQEALAIQDELARAQPDSAELAQARFESHSRMARWLSIAHRFDEGLRHAVAAEQIAEKFATRDPGDLEWQLSLARTKAQLGKVYFYMGKMAEAAPGFEQAHAIYHRLASRDPENRAWEYELAANLSELADVHVRLGAVDPARASLREVIVKLAGLVAREPERVSWRETLWRAYMYAGNLDRLDPTAETVDQVEKGLAIIDALAAREPANPRWQQFLAATSGLVGQVYTNRERVPEALPHLERALSILERLAREDQTNRTNQINLGEGHGLMASALIRGGRGEEALDHMRAALRIGEGILRETPAFQQRRVALANMYAELATRLEGRPADAEEMRQSLVRARDLFAALEAEGPLAPVSARAYGRVKARLRR